MSSFRKFTKLSAPYLNAEQYSSLGHTIVAGNSPLLLSAPHGVSQVRLCKIKVAEIGSARLAIALASQTSTPLIIKTKNKMDDANFDKNCQYRKDMAQYVLSNNIKYILDFHGLASNRECDINLGTNLGLNVKNNPELFEKIVNILESDGFYVAIDKPFSAPEKTISGAFSSTYGLWTLQIEVNCGITNNPKNINKLDKLISSLTKCINLIKEQ